jgi:hypothetical protein
MARIDAQRLVLELIRSAGGAWDGKARLFKAFYFAHLYYARSEPGILTDWPIVRTPRGPGRPFQRSRQERLAEDRAHP